jgi:hypothetical protein
MQMSYTFTVGAADAHFEVRRAIDAYIPLLECCYQLAKGLPFQIPPGYEEIGRVQASPGEVARIAQEDTHAGVQPEAAAIAAEVVNPDAFGFVIREVASSNVLVCIRGTLVVEEWLQNFTAIPADYQFIEQFGTVHLGFREIYRSIQTSIHQSLLEVSPHLRITLVGHSLGGALATLAAPDIRRTLAREHVDVCTIGGPRVGKPDFRQRFNTDVPQCFRVTNQFDIVPHVPTIATGWLHVGEEIEVDGNLSNAHSLDAYLAGLRGIEGPGPGLTARATEQRGLVSATVP